MSSSKRWRKISWKCVVATSSGQSAPRRRRWLIVAPSSAMPSTDAVPWSERRESGGREVKKAHKEGYPSRCKKKCDIRFTLPNSSSKIRLLSEQECKAKET